MDLSWGSIAKTAIAAGIFTALFTQVVVWIRERLSANQRVRLLAVKLTIIFEKFAMDCASSISDNQLYNESDHAAGKENHRLPKMDELPSSEDWHSLKPELTARILFFPNEISNSNSSLDFLEDVEGPYDIPQACSIRCGLRGYRAWLIAGDLRRIYKLPPFDNSAVFWDFAEVLLPLHKKANELEQH
ncbi:hypothetical protein [Inquilinus sp.]|uniref:hypothetical protein n=1 Tax=Inquilinus sp. TaxID=1932117 RepID=UPI003783F0A9